MSNTEIRILDLDNPNWETYDPKDHKAGPHDYPDDLLGKVEWARTHLEGPQETADGTVGLAICHMEGTETETYPMRTRAETEVIILLEGSVEGELEDGSPLKVEAPQVVYCPRGSSSSWRYSSDYRGVYILLW